MILKERKESKSATKELKEFTCFYKCAVFTLYSVIYNYINISNFPVVDFKVI